MNIMPKKINSAKTAAIFLVLAIFLLNAVSAYGIASPYWKGHPLTIAPGDTKIVSITIQNMDDADIVVKVSLKKGSEIASIPEGEYTVPSKTIHTEIPVTITIPKNASYEKLYEVTLASSEVISGDTGGVALGLAIDTTFDVLVADVPKTKKKGLPVTLIISGIVIILALFSAYFIRKKKSRK